MLEIKTHAYVDRLLFLFLQDRSSFDDLMGSACASSVKWGQLLKDLKSTLMLGI